MPAYVYLAAAIITEIIATSALKSSDGFSRLVPSIIVVLGYSFSFYCLSLCLKTMPMGVAYATWSAVGIVLVSIVGLVMFKQSLDMAAIAGMLLIIAGVVVMFAFSSSAKH